MSPHRFSGLELLRIAALVLRLVLLFVLRAGVVVLALGVVLIGAIHRIRIHLVILVFHKTHLAFTVCSVTSGVQFHAVRDHLPDKHLGPVIPLGYVPHANLGIGAV